MNEQNIKETISNRERNVDALFGFLHIKGKPFLHQRAAQHMFGETDSTVVVPVNTIRNIWDESGNKVEHIVKIATLSLLVIGVIAFTVYLFGQDPSFVIPFI